MNIFLENGFDGWLTGNLANNTWSDYKDGYTWFTVFGVFFPTVTGILSGINMSGDLRAPSTDIPNGTLAAFSTGYNITKLVFLLFKVINLIPYFSYYTCYAFMLIIYLI